MVRESWEKQQAAQGGEQKMGDRVPSFFNSPSLTNLGGLGITDQKSLDGLRELAQSRSNSANNTSSDAIPSADGGGASRDIYYKLVISRML